ncbi:MAG: peptidoglycan-binding domain-containing protein [Betaproteobacteria bacterium]
MPRRRQQSFLTRVVSGAGALGFRAWDLIARRPVDSIAIIAAIATAFVIVVNAIFLQSSTHAPPLFDAKSPTAKSDSLKPLITGTPARPLTTAPAPAPQPVAARRNDAIAELIGPSPRIAAVQRALAEFGYGQVKVSGILDDATSAAIAKFERDHNLPSSGRVSDRLVKELTAMVGHPID